MIQQFHYWAYTLRKPELKKTYIPQCSALFTIARTWRQLSSSLTDRWIKKLCYKYTMEYYSATKKNDIMPFAIANDLEIIILSEISQTEKDRYIITLICGI